MFNRLKRARQSAPPPQAAKPHQGVQPSSAAAEQASEHRLGGAEPTQTIQRNEPEPTRTLERSPATETRASPNGGRVLGQREHDEVEVPRRSGLFVFRRTLREFLDDQCTDLAAALTYYSVLAVFPAVLALLGMLGLVGQGQRAVDKILETLGPMVSSSTIDRIRPILASLLSSQGAGLTLVVGIVLALYSASAYVGAFARMMNRVYEVEEGRPAWRLKPAQLLLTVVSVGLCAVALVILVVSGPVTQSVGDTLGVGNRAVAAWNIAKWPVLALVVVLNVALLYHFTPNVRFRKFRWLSRGAVVALVVWVLASVGFAFYVANFSSYNKTYGSIAGVIITLLWLWLTNLALLFGAELESELERGHELRDGLPAEERLQLPVRSERAIEKSQGRMSKLVGQDRAIREAAAGPGDRNDRPFFRGR